MSEEDHKLELPEEVLPPKEEAVEEPQEEVSSQEEPQYSDVEQKAMAQGWRPPEEFNEEGKEAVSAEEYLRRAPIFEKLDKLRSQYRNATHKLQEEIKELKNLVSEERVRGYEQALADLDAKRREAVEYGDLDSFNQLDSEYNRVREQQAQLARQPQTAEETEVPQEVYDFQSKNQDWFNSNTPENNSMVTQAIAIDEHLATTQPYLTDKQRLDKVELEIKNLYPHRFSNPRKKQPSTVESSGGEKPVTSSNTSSTKLKYSDLSEGQKAACEQFLALDPNAKAEDYIRHLEESLRMRRQL